MSPPRSLSDSPMNRRYQVEREEVIVQKQKPIEVNKRRMESVGEVTRNYLSHAEVKPQQDMVKMLPASEPRKSSSSKPISIQPVQKPHFKKHLQNTTAQQGHPIVLNCIIQSSPDIDIKWYSNGNLIQPSTDIIISFDAETGDCTLRIVEVYPEDSGQYTVVVTNSAGSESSTCWLIVKEPSPQRNQVVQPIEPVRRSVSSRPSESKPSPLNLGPIKSSRVEPTEQKPVEIIRAYQKYPDTGIPKVIEHLNDTILVQGGQVFFQCRFDGHPLKIQWYKGDREITSQYRHRMSFDDKTGTARLCISTVLEDDADVYICRAYNDLGEAFTKASLVPEERPIPERPRHSVGQDEVFDKQQPIEQSVPQPAKIIRGLKSEQVKENDFIVLKALITGNPLPSVIYLFFEKNL